MATYRLKRMTKSFGIIGETAGGAMQAAGNVMNSGVGGLAGGFAGMSMGGDALSGVLDAAGVPMSGLIGHGAAFVAGKQLTQQVGKGIKNAGQDLAAESSAGY